MKNKRLIVKTYNIFYTIAILILTEPDYIGTISFLNKYIYNPLTIAIFFVVVILNIKYNTLDKVLILIFLFYLSIFFPTLIYNGDLYTAISSAVKVLAFILLMNLGIKRRGNEFVKLVGKVYFIYAIINLGSMILFPNGLFALDSAEHSWFLGHKNGIIKWLLPGVAFVGVPELLKYNKLTLKFWIYMSILVISIILSKSTTSMISVIILFILIGASMKKKKFNKLINMNSSIIINILFFIGIVIMRLQNYFSKFIVDLLGKELNFTGRDMLWDRILNYIFEKPIIGHGITDFSIMREQLHYTNVSSHNFILDYWYEGGCIGLGIFIVILLIANKKLEKLKNKEIVFIINNVFFAFSIVFMTETFLGINLINVFSLIILAYNVELLFLNKEENVDYKF